MLVLDYNQIASLLDPSQISAALRHAFVAYSQGRTKVPPHALLSFAQPRAECHVRTGWIEGQSAYVVKVSNGFYDNPALGLPSSDGLMALFCPRTGSPLAILADRGLLTDTRTQRLCGGQPAPGDDAAQRRRRDDLPDS